jgi:hypothetical protein
MNKKQKILTVIALAVFAGIIAGHYSSPNGRYGFYPSDYGWYYLDLSASGKYGFIPDVRLPIFALAVFYAGLFFLFGGKDTDEVPRRPRDWRRIKIIGVILAGLVLIVGLIAAIIHFHEEERRSEQSRRDAIEEEDSKHRITSSEIDLIDLGLGRLQYGTGYYLTGRIRNRAAHNRTLNSITLIVTLREKEGSPDIVGQQTVLIRVEVPPHQTRAIRQTIYFDNLPQLTQHAWECFISEIRGSKGYDDVFDEAAKQMEAEKKHGTAKLSDIIETVDPKTGKRKKIDLSNLPDASPTP